MYKSDRTPKSVCFVNIAGFIFLIIGILSEGWFKTGNSLMPFYLLFIGGCIVLWVFAYFYIRNISISRNLWLFAFVFGLLFLIYSIWLSFKIAGTQEMFFANSEVYSLTCLFILTDTIVFFLKAKNGNIDSASEKTAETA